MTRISDLNRNQDLTDGDVFPIGAEDGSTRGVAAKDAAKYFTSEIEPIVDEAKQAALEAQQSAEEAAESAASSDALVLRQDLAAAGGAGLVGGLAKPVTWVGFAGGADPTGVLSADAAFTAAGTSGATCYVPDGTYLLNATITSGSWVVSEGAEFTGSGGIQTQAIRFTPLVTDYGLGKGKRWVSDSPPVKIHRFRDRLFIGGSANNSGGISSITGEHSWLDDPTQTGLKPGNASLEQNATLAVATESGLNAAVFATRASDYSLSTGSTIGATSLALNDKVTVGYRQGALAHYMVSILSSNASSDSGYSCTGLESNLWNQKLDASQIDPYNFFPTDLVKNLWLSNGFPENEHTRESFNSTCAMGILNNVVDGTKGKYRTGIAFKATSLEGSDGISGRGIALSLARGHSFQWHYAGGAQGPFINSSVDSATNEIQALEFTNFGLQVKNRATNKIHLLVASSPSIANYPRLAPSAAGSPVRYMADGDDTNIDIQLSPKGTGNVKINSDLVPSTANSRNCGSSGLPWAGGFTQTAFTVTSDARYKTAPLEITDEMLDAVEDVDWEMFKYLDRVDEKGSDGARWHFGAIAQRFIEAFEKHGLKPFDYAFICHDKWDDVWERRQINEGVEVPGLRTVDRPVMVTSKREVVLEDGSVDILDVQTPTFKQVYLSDLLGNPILDEHGVRAFQFEPVMEPVIEECMVPAEPEFVDVLVLPAGERYGIRYEQAIILKQKQIERDHQRQLDALVVRIEALEAK